MSTKENKNVNTNIKMTEAKLAEVKENIVSLNNDVEECEKYIKDTLSTIEKISEAVESLIHIHVKIQSFQKMLGDYAENKDSSSTTEGIAEYMLCLVLLKTAIIRFQEVLRQKEAGVRKNNDSKPKINGTKN